MSISKTCRPVTLVKKGGSGMKKKLESTKKSFPVLIDLNMQIGEPRLRVILALLFFFVRSTFGSKKTNMRREGIDAAAHIAFFLLSFSFLSHK